MRIDSRRARAVLAVLTVSLPLAFAGAAQADDPGWPGLEGGQTVVVAGTIVSVDAAHNSFVANAYIAGEPRDASKPPEPTETSDGDAQSSGPAPGPGGLGPAGPGAGPGGPGPGAFAPGGPGEPGGHHAGGPDTAVPDGMSTTPTQVTITIGPSTTLRVADKTATIADLAPNQKFVAMFKGDSTETITTLVQNNPPIGVVAYAPPAVRQLYAFVGTVTAIDTIKGTVTVNVTNSLPSGLVPAASNPATFTVGGDTLILGGSSTNGLSWGSLGNVTVGDVVAGGEVGTAGETLAQVESAQLRLLLDFPVASATHAVKAQTQIRALDKARSLLGFRAAPAKSKKHKGNGKHKGKGNGKHKGKK